MFARHADLLRKEVVVVAGGVTYRGVLIEVTAEDVKLRGKTGWILLPFEAVRSIRRADEALRGFDPRRSVGAEFYEPERPTVAADGAAAELVLEPAPESEPPAELVLETVREPPAELVLEPAPETPAAVLPTPPAVDPLVAAAAAFEDDGEEPIPASELLATPAADDEKTPPDPSRRE